MFSVEVTFFWSPKAQFLTPKRTMLTKNWAKIWFSPNFGHGGPNNLRATSSKYVVDNLFRDTPLNHIWNNQPNTRIGPNMAKYGQITPKMVLGPSGTPRGHFLWVQRGPPAPPLPPNESYNVQPCSTSVQPIWGSRGSLWPNIAKYGQNGLFGGPLRPLGPRPVTEGTDGLLLGKCVSILI